MTKKNATVVISTIFSVESVCTCWWTKCNQWRAVWSWGWSKVGSGHHGESSPGQTAACSQQDCDLLKGDSHEDPQLSNADFRTAIMASVIALP